tara:strand:+ start:393 stop:623 length:231 start_codon:yes stop_codon:yes gene_type:complete
MSTSEVMIRIDKFYAAIKTLKASAICSVNDDMQDENDFNKVEWITGEDEFGRAITTTTNPHSEITWTKVKEEMDKL